MKTCKWNFKFILPGILAIAAVAFFFSCEIGLGGAVDTQPPAITITNPPVDSVIRDNFVLSGTYSDDGSISAVSAVLSRPDGKGKNISITSYTLNADATEKGAGRWSLPVNALSDKGVKLIPDGTYQATVSVKDGAGRITTQNTTFTIDNTAPVIVLQRPSSSELSDPKDIDSYGQKLTFEGMAADDNNIDLMEVYIFDPSGSRTVPIHTIKLNNVPNSINTDVAIFKEGVENDYSKIFGSTAKINSTKQLYCKIKAYDSARRYPADGSAQSEQDINLGNATDVYYLYEDIASLVLDSYKITDVYQMFSGTYLLKDSSRSAQDVSTVKQILSQKVINKGLFTINPFNNPSFSILGRDPLKLDGTDFVSTDSTNELMNDSEMIIEVKTGLDAISINSTGLRVYLLPCDDNGTPLSTEESAKLYPVDSTYQKSGTSYKFTSKISKSGFVDKDNNAKRLDFGKTVIVGVEGADDKGNSITPESNQYGFKFTSNGSAPELSIDEPSGYSNTCAKGADFTIEGTVKAENGHAKLYIYKHDSSVIWKNLTLESEKAPYLIESDNGNASVGNLYNGQGSENAGYKFSYTIGQDKFDQDNTKTYVIEVEAEQGRITRESREVIYDVNPPEVRNYDITPVVTKDGDSNIYVNGKITVTGSVYDTKSGVDNSLITCKIQKYIGSSWTDVRTLENENTSDFNFAIDTTEINNTTTSTNRMKLVITAKDDAGNIGTFDYEYVVDQTTDKPVIESNDGSFTKNLTYAQLRANIQSIKDGNEDTPGSNLFLKGSSIAIKVSDDDGLMKKTGNTSSGIKISAWANKKDGTDEFEVDNNYSIAPVYATLTSNSVSTIIAYSLPQRSGSYKIRIDAFDKNYGTSEALETSSASEELYVQIRTDEPEVQISATPSYVTTNTASSLDPTYKKAAYTVSINIKAGTPPFKVTRKVGSTTTTVAENIPNIGIVSDTFTPAASGTGTITYYVYDDFGSSKETPFNYTLDNTRPTATITSNAPTTQATENASVTFKGIASDGDSGSGIARVDVAFKANPAAADIHEASGTVDWSYIARFNELNLTEGTNKFYVRAVDNVGNIGAWVEQQFVYDTGSPVLSDISYSQDSGTTWTSTGTEFDAGKKFSIKGTATDNNGLTKIEIYQNKDSGGEKLIETITASGKSKAWQVNDLPRKPSAVTTHELATGSYAFRVVVYDTCSTAKTSEKEFTAKIDLAAPTVTITSPSADDKLSGSSYTFEGTVSDSGTSGVAEYSYAITNSSTAPTASSSWTVVPKTSGGSWNFAQKLWKPEGPNGDDTLAEGEYYIYVKAKDKAGNETSGNNIQKVHFFIDQNKPTVSFADSVKDYFTKGTLTLTGTASDTHGIKSVKVEYSDGTNTGSFSSDVNGQGVTLTSSDSNKNATWTKTLEFDPTVTGKLRDGIYNFTITATDKAGRTETVSRTIVVDNVAPTFDNVNFSSQTGKGLYYNSTEGVYYVSPDVGTKFILSGTAKDNNGIREVECKVADAALPKVSDVGWSFEINTGTIDGTTKTVQVTVTDKAGNKTEFPEITVKVDTKAPNGVHKPDAKNKDIVFRIGNNDNDDIGPEDGLWDDDLDTDVGGKYSDGTYGNAETIKLRGFFDDASGSGVDLIYYKVFKTQPDSSNKLAQKFLKDGDKTYETQADGYFSLIAPPVEKRVFYTHTNGSTVVDWGGTNFDGKKYYIDDVKYNFLTTISGLSSGENYLVFVAVDKVGNAALESVEVAGVGTFEDYKINVDQVPPTVPNDKIYAPTLFFNTSNTEASNTFKVYGLANDTAAGIREAGVKINGTELFGVYNKNEKKTYLYDKEDTSTRKLVGYLTLTTEGTANVTGATVFNGTALSNNTALWAVELNKDAFAGITSGNSASVSLKVIDNAGAGNSETYPVANVMIDTAGPTVTIKSPASGATVNGMITVSVTASDGTGSGVAETAPVIYKKNGSNWTNLSLTPVNQPDGSWNFQVNTRDFSDNANTILRVSFNDVLGNTGYSGEHTLAVNQDTDRPVITLSQIVKKTTTAETTLKTKNVYGSVTDDDGTIQKMWYWSQMKKGTAPTVAPTLTNANGWKEIAVAGGSWSEESDEDDGETIWYLAVADAQDGIFTTMGTNSLKQPYLKYSGSNTAVNGDSAGITFKYDTNPPTPTYLYLYRAPKNTSTAIATIAADTTIPWSTDSNIAFGADYNVLYAKVVVEESTGMKALEGSNNNAVPSSSPISISYKNDNLYKGKIREVAGTGEEAGTYTYYLGPLVMDTTEQVEFKVTVEDAVGNKGYISRSIIVDNKGPDSISNVKPAKTEAVSGVVNFRGSVSDNENGSGILYKTDDNGNVTAYGVEYFIPTYTQSQDAASAITTGWLSPTTKGSTSWEIEFENLGSTMGYNAGTYAVSEDYANYETIKPTATTEGSGLYDIPVWFRLTDAVGNVDYVTNNSIRYNPNADRPTVQITYPTHGTEGNVTMGGTINISGMANDDDGISAVYLQFDMDGDGTYENGSGIAGTPFADSDLVSIPNTTNQTGILTNGTKSWYKTLSISGLETNTVIKVRAISVEKDSDKNESDYLVSAWSDVLNIKVNNAIPNFSNMKLKKYATAPTSATLSGAPSSGELDYASDMFIKGSETNWYLTGEVDVAATTTISSMSVSGSKTLSYTNDSNNTNDTLISYLDNNQKRCCFAIPVTLTSGSQWKVTITAVDNTSGQAQAQNFVAVINLDGTAPQFADTKTVTVGNQSHEEIKLFKNEYGTNGTELTAEEYIQNSNGSFTLAGKVTEEGSGYERLAFYYKRNKTSNTDSDRVYNPMEEHGPNNQANRTDLVSAQTNGSVYINPEGLPALYLTGLTRSNNLTVASNSLKNNANIRVGGLVKIGDVYRKIDTVDSTNGIITFTPGCDTSYNTAEFIYAMVIDNSGESVNDDGTIKNDDYDRMVESYSKSGTSYIWDAGIDSKHIPDGPIEVHCVVFDKAGNSNHGYTTTMVSNNPPRITSVMFGTDLNADDKYALDKEFMTFYANPTETGGNTTAGKSIWNLDAKIDDTNYWTAKKDLVVIPEFVGGTGTIYYNYSKSTGENAEGLSAAAPGTLTGTATIKALSAGDANILTTTGGSQATLSASQTNNKIGAIILTTGTADNLTTINKGTGEIKNNYAYANVYRFSFWDSTEGCTPGSTSQWSVLNATFKQDLVDDTKPTGEITPFYWEGLSKNSVYSSKATVSSVSDLEGHIELPDDLPASFTQANGEYDKQPKVSGKIKIEGTAFDETRLGLIVLTFANKSVTATYHSDTKTWTNNNTAGTLEISVKDDDGPTQTGHSVKWTVIADTTKVNTSARCANDQQINLTLYDAKPNQETGINIVVDIVPYITGIKTSNRTKSGLKDNNIRSASGKYSIMNAKDTNASTYADDFITINGFNLDPDANDIRVVSSADVSKLTVTNESGTKANRKAAAASSYTSVSISNVIGKSGYLEVFTNGVRSLNNINKNDAYGTAKNASGVQLSNTTAQVTDYSNAYNREPDYYTTKNVQLTDDRYLRLWDMKDTGVKNGYYPVMLMNGNNPVFGYVNKSGGSSGTASVGNNTNAGSYMASHAMPQRTEFNGSTAARIDTEYLIKASTWDQMGMAVDEGGRYYNVSVYNRDGAAMSLIYDRYNEIETPASGYGWGAGTGYSGYEGSYSNDENNNAIALENVVYGNTLLTERYQYPKLIAKGNSTNGDATIYMSYYDDATGELLFRNFRIGTNVTAISETPVYTFTYQGSDGRNYYFSGSKTTWNGKYVRVNGNFRQLTYDDNYGLYRLANNPVNSTFTSSIYSSNNNGSVYSFDTTLSSADVYGQKVNFLENYKNSSTYNTGRLSVVTSGSKYFDMGVTSDNHVVIVYVDSSTNNLVLKYSTNTIDGSNPTTAVDWTTLTVAFPENVGTYVSLALDGNAVHIAAFDSYDSNLVYMYLPSYNSTALQKVTVDQASAVGNWTKVKVKNHIPYIAYYNATETGGRDPIKLAYVNTAITGTNVVVPAGVDVEPGTAFASGGSANGAATGYTTGSWEYMTIPAITSPQGGDPKFQNVCLDFDNDGLPVVGYLGTNLEFGKWLGE